MTGTSEAGDGSRQSDRQGDGPRQSRRQAHGSRQSGRQGDGPRQTGRDVRGTLRAVALVAAAIVALVLLVQNQEPVQTRMLFWNLEMPRFALLAGVYLLGVVTGWVARRR